MMKITLFTLVLVSAFMLLIPGSNGDYERDRDDNDDENGRWWGQERDRRDVGERERDDNDDGNGWWWGQERDRRDVGERERDDNDDVNGWWWSMGRDRRDVGERDRDDNDNWSDNGSDDNRFGGVFRRD